MAPIKKSLRNTQSAEIELLRYDYIVHRKLNPDMTFFNELDHSTIPTEIWVTAEIVLTPAGTQLTLLSDETLGVFAD